MNKINKIIIGTSCLVWIVVVVLTGLDFLKGSVSAKDGLSTIEKESLGGDEKDFVLKPVRIDEDWLPIMKEVAIYTDIYNQLAAQKVVGSITAEGDVFEAIKKIVNTKIKASGKTIPVQMSKTEVVEKVELDAEGKEIVEQVTQEKITNLTVSIK